MTDYKLDPPMPDPDAQSVTGKHFGINVVTTHDQEIADPSGALQALVRGLGAQTLRFPGGSATELHFDMTDPNSAVSNVPGLPALTPMDAFMAAAGRIGADVALVVPTRVAFAECAAQAMRAGTYGSRSALDPAYLDEVETFVRQAIAEARIAGTRIVTLEIGNEFWGSGQMTAAEYGHVAGQVAVRLQAVLDTLGMGDIQIVAQATSAASKLFSPRDDTQVFITADGEVQSTPPAEPFEAVLVPGQGTAAAQLAALTDAIDAVAGAADAIDGSVLHFYQREGFDGVDVGRDYTFHQFEAFAAHLTRSPDAPELARHVTEWNVATGAYPNNAGLQQAAMMAETFFEMLSNGVTDAQIWPLSFNNAQGTSLTDLGDGRLSIAGEMFRLMQESLPGLTPALDWSVSGRIDVHGYGNEDRVALFVSERSGAAQGEIALDIGTLAPGYRSFVTVTSLWDGGAGGSDAAAAPVVSESRGQVITGDTLQVSLDAWANLRIEMTRVDWTDNRVQGREGHDRIYTYAGDDEVRAAGGHDYLDGGQGNDRLDGGDGHDWLNGGEGQDILTGGAGNDVFMFETGDGVDVLTDLDFSADRLRIDGVDIQSLAELMALPGATLTPDGPALLLDYGTGDRIRLEGQFALSAPALGGRQTGGGSSDYLRGSDGDDDLRGMGGGDILLDGRGRDVLRGGDGTDVFILVRDGAQDRITDFVPGTDRIDLTAWGVTGMSELSFEIDINADGRWMGRGYLRWQDEEVRLDGLDAAMLAAISPDDFMF